jgi:hypothetical protein
MMWSVHQTVITDVLMTIEVVMSSVGTVLTVMELQRRGSEH